MTGPCSIQLHIPNYALIFQQAEDSDGVPLMEDGGGRLLGMSDGFSSEFLKARHPKIIVSWCHPVITRSNLDKEYEPCLQAHYVIRSRQNEEPQVVFWTNLEPDNYIDCS